MMPLTALVHREQGHRPRIWGDRVFCFQMPFRRCCGIRRVIIGDSFGEQPLGDGQQAPIARRSGFEAPPW